MRLAIAILNRPSTEPGELGNSYMLNASNEPLSTSTTAFSDGERLGLADGLELGLELGEKLGLADGEELGLADGRELGLGLGEKLGLADGEALGPILGLAFGEHVSLGMHAQPQVGSTLNSPPMQRSPHAQLYEFPFVLSMYPASQGPRG